MRYLIVEDNVIINTPWASESYAQKQGWEEAPEGVGIGWKRNDPAAPWVPGLEPVEPVPASCQRRQGRLVLLMHGLIDDVEAHIEAIEDPTERRAAQIEYEADTWERDNALINAMWLSLGGTQQSLDDMFRLAVTL